MDKFQRFEYRFPFYKMDVNGFILHVKQAMKMHQPDLHLFQINAVDLVSLQKAFSSFDSWSELKDDNS